MQLRVVNNEESVVEIVTPVVSLGSMDSSPSVSCNWRGKAKSNTPEVIYK